jgi:hypothetical protein
MTDLRSGLSKAEFLLVSAREHADKQVERDRLFYRCACVVTALTAAVAILAVAIAAVVLAMS